MPDTPTVPAADRVPPGDDEPTAKELLSFGAVALPKELARTNASFLILPIFNIGMGFNPLIISMILMFQGIWDSVTDPAVGYISDNFKSKWGRRRPFILVGVVLTAIVGMAIWWFPRDWGETATLTYFGIGIIVFTTVQTIFAVPWGAMQLELSRTYHGRTRVVLFVSVFQKASYLITPWLFTITTLSFFVDELHGVRWTSAVFGTLLLIAGVVCFKYSRERTAVTVQVREGFLHALKNTIVNIHFLKIVWVYVVQLFCIGLFYALGAYVSIFYLFEGDKTRGAAHWAGMESFGNLLAFFAIPLVGIITKKLGKHRALQVSLVSMIIGQVLFYFLMDPSRPFLVYIVPFFHTMGISAVFIILPALMADVIDMDELKSGRRREGLFSAASGFIIKMAYSLANGLTGVLLVWVGFNIDATVVENASSIETLRFWFAFGPIVFLASSILVLRNYPLTEKRIAEVQAELKIRRAAAATEAANPQ